MSSYVNRKTRVFKEAGDINVERKKSDGRMKTYQSATDARAWCDSTEDRRQHILDLVRQGDGKNISLGKLLPLEAIIDILLANKNADIKRLEAENAALKEFIKSHGLTFDEALLPKEKIEEPFEIEFERASTEQEIGVEEPSVGEPMEKGSVETAEKVSAGTIEKMSTGTAEKVPSEKMSAGTAEKVSAGTVEKMSTGTAEKVPSEKMSAGTTEKVSAGTVEKMSAGTAEKVPSEKVSAGTPEKASTGTAEKASIETTEKVLEPSIDYEKEESQVLPVEDEESFKPSEIPAEGVEVKSKESSRPSSILREGSRTSGPETAPDILGEPEEGLSTSVGSRKSVPKSEGSRRSAVSFPSLPKSGEIEVPPSDKSSKKSSAGIMEEIAPEAVSVRSEPKPSQHEIEQQLAVDFLAGKSPNEQLAALKRALGDRDSYSALQHELALAAIEQLENIKDIVDDKDQMRDKSSKPQVAGPRTSYPIPSDSSNTCRSEIEDLERQIEMMKNKGKLSSQEEEEIIKKEVDILKKYCSQLATIQNENAELKKERDLLKVNGASDPTQDNLMTKMQKLDEVTAERDRLRARVDQLERELQNYSDLPEELESFRRKSEALDDLMTDRDNLQMRLNALKGLEDDVRALKNKSGGTEGGKEAVRTAPILKPTLVDKSGKDAANAELERLRCQCAEADRQKDKLEAKTKKLECQLAKVRCKEKESELLQVENNCMKMRLEDMARIQCEYEDLLNKTKGFDCLKAECAKYKAKYEQLQELELECIELREKVAKLRELEEERELLMKEIMECECCMSNQENEIKRLMCHIECLNQDLDKRQDQMKVTCVTMRANLEKKDDLIAKSEQKLADVQSQLRNSIEGVSCETTCLRNRIDELEKDLNTCRMAFQMKLNEEAAFEQRIEEIQKELEETENKLKEACNENDKLQEMLSRVGDGGGDEHIKKIWKQERSAVRCIMEKIAKYEIGDGSERKKNEELLNKLTKLQAELDKANNTIQNIPPVIGDGEKDGMIAQLKLRIQELEEEVANLKNNANKVQPLLEENKALRRHSSQLQEIAKDQISKLENENTTLRSESQKLSTIIENAEDENYGKDEIIARLQRQVADLKDLYDQERRLREEAESMINDLQNNINDMGESGDSSELDKLRQQMDILQAEIDRLNFDLDLEKSKCKEKIDDLLRKSVTDEDARLSRSGEQSRDLSSDLRRLQDENDQSKEQISALVAEIESMRVVEGESTTRESFLDERDDLLRQIEDQKREIADLLDKMKEPMSTDDDATYTELETKNRENAELRSVIEDLERQLRELKETTNLEIPSGSPEVENIINELTKKLEDAERECEKLREELAKCKGSSLSKDLDTSMDSVPEGQEHGAQPEKNPKKEKSERRKSITSKCKERVKELEAQLEQQKKECSETIASLKSQYERDVSNLHSLNRDSIDKLQKAQDGEVKRMSEQHEDAISSLKKEMSKTETDALPDEQPRKKSLTTKTTEDVCICSKMPTVIPIKAPPSSNVVKCICGPAPPTNNETWDIPTLRANTPMAEPMNRSGPFNNYLQPAISRGYEDKVAPIKKIADLENKLRMKQKLTKDKVDDLQNTVNKFKRELELERQRNNDLRSRYNNQSKTVDNMMLEINMVKKENFQDKKRLHELTMTLKGLEQDQEGRSARNMDRMTPNSSCGCANTYPRSQSPQQQNYKIIPHIYTEINSLRGANNRSKPNSVMHNSYRGECGCNHDPFEIDE